MKILDCESRETAYDSIRSITGIDEARLNSIFDDFTPKGVGYRSDELYAVIRKHTDSIAYDRVCMFHFTRVPEGTDFSKGILPLQAALGSIWNFLFTITNEFVSADEWEAFRHEISFGKLTHGGDHCSWAQKLYQMKTEKASAGGPYGLMVRELGFCSKRAGNHDYLAIPEIVEDICKFFECTHGVNPAEKYTAATRSCIVKFSTDQIGRDYLSTACYYLYCKYKDEELSQEVSSGFDSSGTPIAAENILRIEWLDK